MNPIHAAVLGTLQGLTEVAHQQLGVPENGPENS